MEYKVGQTKLEYSITSQVERGDDVILLRNADDLAKDTTWSQAGYSIEPLFDEKTYLSFRDNTTHLLLDLWNRAGLKISQTFSLENYHTLTPTWDIHLKAVEYTRLLNISSFPVAIQTLEERVGEILKCRVIARNPYDGQSIFHFRVIRPNSSDNNPLHRDVWLPEYKDCINLYIPVAGSNEKSSLIIALGSHRWPESYLEKTVGGAEINHIKFNVPAVSKIFAPVEFVRPNPGENEMLIFSPYLIHGGSVNLNKNQTRISIEIRFWRK